MKRTSIYLAAITLLNLLVYFGCGTNDQLTAHGQSNYIGFLLDENSQPIQNATLWIPCSGQNCANTVIRSASAAARKDGLTSANGDCTDPTDANFTTATCSGANGGFRLGSCDSTSADIKGLLPASLGGGAFTFILDCGSNTNVTVSPTP